jgi:hypothetical protein
LRLLAGADRCGDSFSQEDKSLIRDSRLQTGQPLPMWGRIGDLIQFSLQQHRLFSRQAFAGGKLGQIEQCSLLAGRFTRF